MIEKTRCYDQFDSGNLDLEDTSSSSSRGSKVCHWKLEEAGSKYWGRKLSKIEMMKKVGYADVMGNLGMGPVRYREGAERLT